MNTSSANHFSDITLTSSQQSALTALDEFMVSDVPCFMLKGYAGTGKTFLINGLVKWLTKMGRHVVLMAPTGRAAQVLTAKTNYPTYTIHRIIYFGEGIKNWETLGDGDELFRLTYGINTNQFMKDTVFIVDESSMISNAFSDNEFLKFGSGYLLNDLIHYIWPDEINNDYKLIFSGDYAQLPPVDMNFSPALDANYLKENFALDCMEHELTEVVRQKEGGLILENATMLRRRITEETFGSIRLQTGDEVTALSDIRLVNEFCSLSGPDYDQAIIVAHSNRAVFEYNRRIREKRFPGQPLPQPGDRLVVVHNSYFNGRLLLNGEIGTIMSINNQLVNEHPVKLKVKTGNQKHAVEQNIKLSFREAVIRFGNDEQNDVTTLILDNVLFSDERDISSPEQQALFVDCKIRHKFKNGDDVAEILRSDKYFNALRVKFGYSLTCHKAQGGEWENVMVDCITSMGFNNEQYFRWLYTAITRARVRLLLLNLPSYQSTLRLKAAGQPQEDYPEKEQEKGEIPKQSAPTKLFAELLFEKIKPTFSESGYLTQEVMYLQYSLQFILHLRERNALIRIFFNARERITLLEVLDAVNFTIEEIKSLFFMLHLNENQIKFKARTDGQTDGIPAIPDLDSFLTRLKKKMEAALAESEILIDKVESKDYHEIYHFSRGTELAVIKFHYNKKKQFTRYEILPNRCNGLESEVLLLIKDIEL